MKELNILEMLNNPHLKQKTENIKHKIEKEGNPTFFRVSLQK